jgi:hypothetical protein
MLQIEYIQQNRLQKTVLFETKFGKKRQDAVKGRAWCGPIVLVDPRPGEWFVAPVPGGFGVITFPVSTEGVLYDPTF